MRDGAEHGRFDEPRALGIDQRRQLAAGHRLQRAHLDEQLALDVAGKKTVRPVENAPHAVILGDDGDHDLRLGGDLAGPGGDAQPIGRKRAGDVGVVIPAHDVKALPTQALRDRRAHPAQSDNSEIHDVLPDPHNERL